MIKWRNKTGPGRDKSGGETAGQTPPLVTPLIQSLMVLLGALLVAGLSLLLVVAPAEKAAMEKAAEEQVERLQQRFDQHLGYVLDLVSGYAAQAPLPRTGSDPESVEAERTLQATLPSARAVFLFPPDAVEQPAGRSFQLGFASIDLARRAQQDNTRLMDAFRRDDQWLVQIAAPVAGEEAQEASGVPGSLLVVFGEELFAPVLRGGREILPGEVVISQQVEGSPQPIARTGQSDPGDNRNTLTRSLAADGWRISYTPANAVVTVFPRSLLWGIPLLVAVLVIVGLWVAFFRQQSRLRRDCASLGSWAQKALAGEPVRMPVLSNTMLAALADSLDRQLQTAVRRSGKARDEPGAANRTARGGGGSSTPPGSDREPDGEPLFDESTSLDIDMLDGDDDVLGLATGEDDSMQIRETAPVAVEVPDSIFRAYDIRGIVGKTLTPEIVTVIGRAIGSEARQRGQSSICVGYDGRHSGPELSEALMQGIMASGVDVIDVGRVPTPVLYFAAHHLQNGSGVMVTGSHNPPDYNGLKMVLGGETLAGDAIQALLTRIREQRLEEGQGQLSQQDVKSAYLDAIVGDIAVAAPLKVVLDAGNGIAGELAPKLVRELGCEVIPLYCEVDGNFPNHHPDPGKPENLEALIETVRREGADLGIAFDGDGDRIGVVTESGKIIWPDRLLMLFARDVVSRNPGADIIYDVKCSRRLATVINEFGGRPVMWRTGHSWIKAKMKSMGALLAGEMSGHIFFKERWYGFDDGLYAAARLLEILGIDERGVDAIFADFPEDYSTPEINLEVTDENKFAIIDSLASQADFGDGNVTDIDGLRVDYADGWGLCRASNTTPMLVLRFEAETEDGLERIKTVFREQMQRIQPDLTIPF
ncbi:MAG: phosphomannomutase/phosphoglucomutase [Oleiphilaceae bacterium]|nr:phosphomannomutase/phosphoglucomutase [Oleiphilaceae bacterium]